MHRSSAHIWASWEFGWHDVDDDRSRSWLSARRSDGEHERGRRRWGWRRPQHDGWHHGRSGHPSAAGGPREHVLGGAQDARRQEIHRRRWWPWPLPCRHQAQQAPALWLHVVAALVCQQQTNQGAPRQAGRTQESQRHEGMKNSCASIWYKSRIWWN